MVCSCTGSNQDGLLIYSYLIISCFLSLLNSKESDIIENIRQVIVFNPIEISTILWYRYRNFKLSCWKLLVHRAILKVRLIRSR